MKETTANQGSLPSKKIFIFCVVLVAFLTLVLVHLTGQWVGQRIFAKELDVGDRLAQTSIQTRLQTRRRKIQTNQELADEDFWRSSEKQSDPVAHYKEKTQSKSYPDKESKSNWKDLFKTLQKELSMKRSEKLNSPSRGPTVAKSTYLNSTLQATHITGESFKEVKKRKSAKEYQWNDRDWNSHQGLPLRSANDTRWKRENALIFNRVGKCGSRNVITLLRKLAIRNNFNLLSSIVYNSTAINVEWQNYIVKTLDQMQTPYLFQRHLHFVYFPPFGARQPTYINIIRDPISRFVSNYYFKRFGDGQSNQNFKGTEEEKYMSVTECVLKNHSDCTPRRLLYIIPFFCGQYKYCRQPTQWALDQAKRNVEKYFAVVGILEDLEGTFRVFEKLMPQYFDGMVELFLKPDKDQLTKNTSTLTKFKEKPSPDAEAVMRESMKFEYEFYYFVKDRLDWQKQAYGIQTEVRHH